MGRGICLARPSDHRDPPRLVAREVAWPPSVLVANYLDRQRSLAAFFKLDALTAADNSNPLFLIAVSAILGAVLGYLMGQLAGVLKARIARAAS
jgi:hypothetical protein